MTINEILDEIKRRPIAIELLKKVNHGAKIGYECICDGCTGGTGKHGTGATPYAGNTRLGCYTCKENGRYGTFTNVDVIAYHIGLSVTGAPITGADALKVAQFAADYFNLPLDGQAVVVAAPRDIPPSSVNHDAAAEAALKAKIKEITAADIAKYLANPEDYRVPSQFARAITPEMYQRFHVVYDPQWTPPRHRADGTFFTPSKRIIFICGNFYVARLADSPENYPASIRGYFRKVKAENAGEVEIFNGGVIDTVAGAAHIFVFEGAFDALSLLQIGAENVVAIHGTPHWRKLLDRIKARSDGGKKLAVNILFDDDNGGRTAAKAFQRELVANGIPAIAVTLPRAEGDTSDEKNDANYILQKFGADALSKSFLHAFDGSAAKFAAVEEEIARRADLPAAPETDSDSSTSTGEENAAAAESKIEIVPGVISLGRYALNEFFADIERDAQFADRKTGFASLDACAAFLPGVGFLGGGTGAGKSDFVIQLLDQICTAGMYGLYLPLELPKKAVQSRIFARRLYLDDPKSPPASYIRTHGKYEPLRSQLEKAGRKFYEQVGDRLEVDNDISFTREQLCEKIKRYCARVPVPPVIVLDYLQLVNFTDERERRVAIDKLSRALKEVQMNTDATIIAVSSVNRSAYKLAAENSALKESGGIEFNADFIWILQLSIIEDSEEPVTVKQLDEAARQIPRLISLKCTKNRDALPFSTRFDYFSGHSYFAPYSNNHGSYEQGEVSLSTGGK